MKGTKSIVVDLNDWDALQKTGINMSAEIRGFLSNLRSSQEDNIEGINMKIEKMKHKELVNKISKVTAEIKATESRINRYDKLQIEKQENALKQEKERISNQTKCKHCGNQCDDKSLKQINDDTILCRSCSLDSSIVGQYLTVRKSIL